MTANRADIGDFLKRTADSISATHLRCKERPSRGEPHARERSKSHPFLAFGERSPPFLRPSQSDESGFYDRRRELPLPMAAGTVTA
jgi:hypothetical protein